MSRRRGDRTAKVWRVFRTTQELIDYANQIVPRRLTCEQRRQFFLRDAPCPDLEQAQELAAHGQVQEAIAIYTEAETFDSTQISASSWNNLCWFGSLEGQAAAVLYACEQAVGLQPDNGGIRDSRGVARALTGDFAGEIEDFEVYVGWTRNEEYKTQRQGWIDALHKGENPFTPERLEELRKELHE